MATVMTAAATSGGGGKQQQHPALEATASFCRRELKEAESAPHAVNLVRVVLPFCPPAIAEPLLVDLLQVMSKAQSVLLLSCLEAISQLFASGAPLLSTALLAKTVDALFEVQPGVAAAGPRAQWNSTVGTGYRELARRDPAACCAAVPRYVRELLPCYGSSRPELVSSVTQCLAGVVEACVVPLVAAAQSEADLVPMVAVADSLCEGLKLRSVCAFTCHHSF